MQKHLKWCGLIVALATAGAGQRGDAAPKKAGIAWKPSFQSALQEAKKTGKPIMVDFHATWCGPCHLLDKNTYSNPAVIRESKKWVSVKVDVDAEPKIAQKYKVTAMPTIAFLKPTGATATKFEGYVEPAEMLKSMKAAHIKARRKS